MIAVLGAVSSQLCTLSSTTCTSLDGL